VCYDRRKVVKIMFDEKKEWRLEIMLSKEDVKALVTGMQLVGETNKSGYVRRLLHEHKGYKYEPVKVLINPNGGLR